ncbi:MAG: DUF4367 domain-containing protein [Bacillota bacterium]|jgi:hypothetical protein
MKRAYDKKQSEADNLLLEYASDAIVREEMVKFDLARQEYAYIHFPDGLRENAELLIKRWQKRNSRTARYRVIKNLSKAAAALVLAVVLSTAALCTVSEAFRAEVLNLIYTVYDRYDEVKTNYNEDVQIPKYDPNARFMLQPEYIPAGYFLVQEDSDFLIYQNAEGYYLEVDYFGKNESAYIDNEDVAVKRVFCNGMEIELRYKKGGYLAIWQDKGIVFVVNATIMDKKTLLKFIDNLYWIYDEK